MACCNAHILIWAVNVLDGLHLKLFADVRQAFLLSASIYCGDAQLMVSMLSRYQLSEVDLLCATCTLKLNTIDSAVCYQSIYHYILSLF